MVASLPGDKEMSHFPDDQMDDFEVPDGFGDSLFVARSEDHRDEVVIHDRATGEEAHIKGARLPALIDALQRIYDSAFEE